jgi:hypothetical protein
MRWLQLSGAPEIVSRWIGRGEMQEFWYCDRCGSMNRADSGRCYKCRAGKANATAGTTTVLRQGYVAAPALDDENRGIARAYMSQGRYVSAWQIGYLTGFVTIVAVAFEALYATIAVLHAISRSPGYASPKAFPWFETPPAVLGLAVAALVLVGLVLQGLFLCLTSMNSPALGSGTARFGPFRCAVWPLESVLWAVWGLGGLRAYDRWWARRLYLGDPLSSATDNPPRLLQDLLDRLWVPRRSGSGLVPLWGTAWAALVLIGYLLLFTLVLALIGTPLPFVVLLAIGSCDFAWCFITLARITFEMARRQHIREQWVLDNLRPATAGRPALVGRDGGGTTLPPSPVAPAPPPAPPSTLGPASGPVASPWRRSTPIAIYKAPGEEISWSRPVERVASPPESQALDQLPAAWQRAVEATAPVTAKGRQLPIEEQSPELSDRHVVQPSSSTIPRYRAPFADAEPLPAADGKMIDPGPGSGI